MAVEIDRINARSSKQFVCFWIVATVLMGLTLVVFKRSILAPWPHPGQAADAISAGHYEAPPVVNRGDDELGRTAKSFNLMQAEIRATMIWALEKVQFEMEKHLLERGGRQQMQKKTVSGSCFRVASASKPDQSSLPVQHPQHHIAALARNTKNRHPCQRI